MKTSAKPTSSRPYGYKPKQAKNLKQQRENKTVTYKGKEMTAKKAEQMMKADNEAALKAGRERIANGLTNPTQQTIDAIRSDVETFGTGGRNGQRHAVDVFNHTQKIESERGFYNWALTQVQNKSDLDVVKDWINHHGTQEQKELVAKWESHFAHPTWQSYANLHGTQYTAPTPTGIKAGYERAYADSTAKIEEARKAAEEAKNIVSVIEESAPAIEEGSKVTEEVSQVTNKASKFGKYAKWASIAVLGGLLVGGALYLLNKCTSDKSNPAAGAISPQPQQPKQKPPVVQPDPVKQKPTPDTSPAVVDTVQINKSDSISQDFVIAGKGDSYSRITNRDFMKSFTDEEKAKLEARANELGMKVADYVAKYYTIKGQTVNGDTLSVDWNHAQPRPNVGDTVYNKKPDIDFDNLK